MLNLFLFSLTISFRRFDQVAWQSEEGDETDAILYLYVGVRLEDRGILYQLVTDTIHKGGENRTSFHHAG